MGTNFDILSNTVSSSLKGQPRLVYVLTYSVKEAHSLLTNQSFKILNLLHQEHLTCVITDWLSLGLRKWPVETKLLTRSREVNLILQKCKYPFSNLGNLLNTDFLFCFSENSLPNLMHQQTSDEEVEHSFENWCLPEMGEAITLYVAVTCLLFKRRSYVDIKILFELFHKGETHWWKTEHSWYQLERFPCKNFKKYWRLPAARENVYLESSWIF